MPVNKQTIKILSKVYFDPAHPAGFSTVDKLWTSVGKKIPKDDVRLWLRSVDVFTLHRPLRRRIPRNHYIVSNRFELFEADLMDLQTIARDNDAHRYILVVIDCFSRYVWARALLRKTGREITDAFVDIFEEIGNKTLTLRTDAGTEFTNSVFQAYLAKNDITYIRTYDPTTKASIVERVIRTLKGRLWKYFTHKNTHRYINVLPSVINAYNHSVHRSLKMSPHMVTDDNIKTVYHNIHEAFKNEKTNVRRHLVPGDHVRISVEKGNFEKSYLVNWSEEIFLVTHVIKRLPRVVYRLQDMDKEEIRGLFYAEELQLVKYDPYKTYAINKILDTRGRGRGKEVLVSWKGFPLKKFNSWILASEIKQK